MVVYLGLDHFQSLFLVADFPVEGYTDVVQVVAVVVVVAVVGVDTVADTVAYIGLAVHCCDIDFVEHRCEESSPLHQQ